MRISLQSAILVKFCKNPRDIYLPGNPCNCIRNAHTENMDKLESLLSWNFQSFKNVKISAV